MEHVTTYHLELNYASATLYGLIFVYGLVAAVRDLARLLSRWLG